MWFRGGGGGLGFIKFVHFSSFAWLSSFYIRSMPNYFLATPGDISGFIHYFFLVMIYELVFTYRGSAVVNSAGHFIRSCRPLLSYVFSCLFCLVTGCLRIIGER